MSSIIKVNTVQDQDGNNIINENANTITIGASGDTISIPAGATLANSGTATGFASIAWQSSIVTAATHTAAAGQGLWLDTSSNAITLTLPASPSVGDQIIFTDYARNWVANPVTLNLNSEKFQGNTTPVPVYNTTGESVDIVYSGSTKGWIPNNDGAVALETPQIYSADVLVVAGGGAGGGLASIGDGGGGGGGAGGFRTASSITINGGTTYTITVGDGGAGSLSAQNPGSNSSISGSGLTTITSAGGGAAGNDSNANGLAGGSGGGSFWTATSTFAAGNTPSTTPSQGNNGANGQSTGPSTYRGGGGGGASVAPTNENGGNGTASSITGSAVTYSGGGGGGKYNDSGDTGGTGGNGGGGQGASMKAGNPGTANTGGGGGGVGGGGGGGTGQVENSGAGGKGVVILSVPDASYSGTVTGSPTVATGVSGKTVITFTGTGSYTG